MQFYLIKKRFLILLVAAFIVSSLGTSVLFVSPSLADNPLLISPRSYAINSEKLPVSAGREGGVWRNVHNHELWVTMSVNPDDSWCYNRGRGIRRRKCTSYLGRSGNFCDGRQCTMPGERTGALVYYRNSDPGRKRLFVSRRGRPETRRIRVAAGDWLFFNMNDDNFGDNAGEIDVRFRAEDCTGSQGCRQVY